MTLNNITFAALALAIATTAVFAQDAPSPTRAEVKAQTRALEKAGKLTPAGEGSPVGPEASFKSTKTRSERKAETHLAVKNRELAPPGAAGLYAAEDSIRAQKTTRSIEERKAETKRAGKRGQLIPAGEGPDAPRR